MCVCGSDVCGGVMCVCGSDVCGRREECISGSGVWLVA